MGRRGGVQRSRAVLAGGGFGLIAIIALLGYQNMPPDPAYVTVDRYGFNDLDIARETLPAFAFAVAGLVAWQRRPQNRVGPLMVMIGVAILLKGFQGIPIPPVVSLGIWASLAPAVLPALLLGVLVLVYPTGRFSSRIDRWWVVFAGVYFLTVQLAWAMFTPSTRDSTKCGDCYSLLPALIGGYNDYVRLNLRNLSMLIFVALAIALIALVVRRWIRASPPARRLMAPVWVAGIVVAVVAGSSSILIASIRFESTFVAYAVVPSIGDFLVGRIPVTTQGLLPWVMSASLLLVPAALLWGLLRSLLSPSAVVGLAVELGRPSDQRPPLIQSLRRALGDRSVDLALWSRPASAYVTPDGRPTILPDRNSGRAVTNLQGDEGLLAAIIHDPALAEQRQLFDGVAAVAKLAIENERLHAEVKSQLEEVRASRQRIVSAADEERRRVERNIHDGAQQRLVSLSMALRMAQAKATDASPEVTATLVDAEAELKHAIGELRALARGIHPAILTEAGLGQALVSLAEHTPIAVDVEAEVDGSLSPLIETTVYYVVAEALTNVAKHAGATAATVRVMTAGDRLSIRVADNGAGGADPTQGTGIRGLMDRVAALGGTLRIMEAPEGGTRLEAEIPCVSA